MVGDFQNLEVAGIRSCGRGKNVPLLYDHPVDLCKVGNILFFFRFKFHETEADVELFYIL